METVQLVLSQFKNFLTYWIQNWIRSLCAKNNEWTLWIGDVCHINRSGPFFWDTEYMTYKSFSSMLVKRFTYVKLLLCARGYRDFFMLLFDRLDGCPAAPRGPLSLYAVRLNSAFDWAVLQGPRRPHSYFEVTSGLRIWKEYCFLHYRFVLGCGCSCCLHCTAFLISFIIKPPFAIAKAA